MCVLDPPRHGFSPPPSDFSCLLAPALFHLPLLAGLPSGTEGMLNGGARASLADTAAQMARLLFVSCAGSLVMLALTLRMRLT